MDNIVDFHAKRGAEQAKTNEDEEKMKLISSLFPVLKVAIERMRSLGATDARIAAMFRHAASELDHKKG